MTRFARLVFALIFAGLGLAACGRGDLFAPTATSVLFVPSKTPVQPTATADPAAAAARGQVLFTTFSDQVGFACSTCHHVDRDDQLVGPGLKTVRVRAETRIAGIDAQDYLHDSIVNPSAYVVEGFPDNLMPQVYAQIFSEAQISDIIAYLMAL